VIIFAIIFSNFRKTPPIMAKKRQFVFSRIALTALGLGVLFLALNITQTSCGGDVPKTKDMVKADQITGAKSLIQPVFSGTMPSEVAFPDSIGPLPVDARPFFDQFSWQTFIALCWPVTPGQRGVPLNPNDPNAFLNMTNSSPVVWTSYKNQWDLFGQGINTPSPWNSWDNPVSLCQKGDTLRHIFRSAKSEMLPGDGDESFSVPLIDQNQNYALFEIKYNEVQYNFLVNNGLYLNSNLYDYKKKNGGAVTMPSSTATTEGSILVKAAWRQLTAKDDPSRYYVIDELVYDPVSKQCVKQKMGLIGLHIAQKVNTFPQWVWSSFEQVDNVPGAPNAKAPYSFNNGTNNPATIGGFANKPISASLISDKSQRTPVQVTRFNQIPTTPVGVSTVDINQIYQKAVGNSWMQYYQLVITQWPTNPTVFKQYTKNGKYPGDCGQPFPIDSCINTTMETYFQSPNDAVGAGGKGGNSCMGCHYKAPNTDFSWSLQLRSH